MAGLKLLKNHCVASLGEFVGTFLFLFFAFAGTQLANLPSTQTADQTGPNLTQLMYISLIFGFSLAINVWVFFRISGGLFNPAVTLALCITGAVPLLRSLFIFVAQILGAIAAAGLMKGIIPGNEIRFSTQLMEGTSIAQGLFLEMFLTCELVFTILMLAAEKTKATFIAPVGIGLALFVAELIGVYWTGGSLNPARSFGPAVVSRQFNSYHWIYWLGPVLGALLACAFYKLLKFLNYEEVNGDQDKSKHDERIMGTRQNDGDNDESGIYHENHSFKRKHGESRRSDRSGIHSHRNSDVEKNDQHQNHISYNSPSFATHEVPHRQQNRNFPPQAHQHQKQSQEPTPQTFSDAQNYQHSRAFAPEPAPLQHSSSQAPEEGTFEPSPIVGADGRLYVQDADAQNRVLRRQSMGRGQRARAEEVRKQGSKRRDKRG